MSEPSSEPIDSPTVSIIVVNWNRRRQLAACLESLRKQRFRDFETVVVDNGSDDGSRELLRDPRYSWVRCLANDGNLGFCRANNQGIRASRGAYVALLNNDAVAKPHWLEEMVRVLDSHPEVGMTACKILVQKDPRIIDKAGHLIFLDGQNRGRGTGERDAGQYDTVDETAWPDGCAALYRRELLEQLGGFDEDFFAYADDAELGLRARIAGWTCLYVPTAVVHHAVGSTLGELSARRVFLIERNRVWLAAKLFPWRLLALNPFYFTLRVAASLWAGVSGSGELAKTAGSIGAWALLKCLVKAEWAALRGLPKMLGKRRAVASIRKLSAAELTRTIRRFQIPLRDLTARTR